MILHSHECVAYRRRVREQPSLAGAWARNPAPFSRQTAEYRRRNETNAGSFPASHELRAERAAEPAGCGCDPRRGLRLAVLTVSEAPGRPCRAFGLRRPGSMEFNPNHDGGSSPAVVVCATEALDALRTGARWSSPGGRHPFFSSGSSAGVASGLARGGCWSPTQVRAEPAKSARYGGDMLRELPPTGSLARHTHYHPSSDSAEALPFVVAHRRCSSFAAHRVQPPSTSRCASESRPKPAPLCSSSTRTWPGGPPSCWTSLPRSQEIPA